MQTRYPVDSDTANSVRGDGVTSVCGALLQTTSTLNFLRLDGRLPSDLSGMRSGFLAGHSQIFHFLSNFSLSPACRTVRDLWDPVRRALAVRHTQLVFKADGTASRCQRFPKTIRTYEEVKSYRCFGRHCSVLLYR